MLLVFFLVEAYALLVLQIPMFFIGGIVQVPHRTHRRPQIESISARDRSQKWRVVLSYRLSKDGDDLLVATLDLSTHVRDEAYQAS